MKLRWSKNFGTQELTLKHSHTMKTNILITGLIAFIICSCTSPKYLPSSDKIDINEFGSYIELVRNTAPNIRGELIAIDTSKIVVLTEDANKCVVVPVSEVKRFSLRYAKPKHYGWTIPVFTLFTATHGVGLLVTAPINLIVTISVTTSGENAFKYSDKNISYNELMMFARFPQGIPPNIDLANIK